MSPRRVIDPVIDVLLDRDEHVAALRRDVVVGLSGTPKTLSPVWFYDEQGSELFDKITRLEEYYPTRAERALLDAHGDDIAAATRASMLMELGSGTSDKTRLLLDALTRSGSLTTYTPLDVSEETLRSASAAIAAEYPGLTVHGIVGDFHRHLGALPEGRRRLLAFLGGTIGNLRPDERSQFYAEVHGSLSADDRFLLGVDLVKPIDRLLAAYDDAAGVTAAFNRNALRTVNAEFDGNFDPDDFDHEVRWDEGEQWIEMHLRANTAHSVELRAVDLAIRFDEGETINTEISAKFTPDGLGGELTAAGFDIDRVWGQDGDFLLVLARPATG